MKTIIYLPLILLVVLCSCKGNAFMKQRYTAFAHASNKNATKEKVVKSEINKDQEPEILQKSEVTMVSASATKDISIANIILPVYSSVNFRNEATTIQTKNVENLDHANTLVKEKKVTHQKSQIAKRLLGTLFKIVLWIIILAVVVGIIIIIGALA